MANEPIKKAKNGTYYFRANLDYHPVTGKQIQKYRSGFSSKKEAKEEYSKYAQNMIYCGNVAAFIRSIIGVDRNIAIQKFTKLISESNLNSMQEEYLKTILNYVCENGDITTSIFGNDPFVNFKWQDAFGDKINDLTQYVENLHKVITA